MGDIAGLKKIVEQIQEDLKNKVTNERIDQLIQTINERDQKITELENRVKELENNNNELKTMKSLYERKIDDNESYTRRQNLRIVGLPESNEKETEIDCINKVKAEFEKLGDIHVNLDLAIDRVHRIGRRKDLHGNLVNRPMIVRFTSWKDRTAIYKKRNKQGDVRFFIDLTKRRFQLKKMAVEKVQGNPKVNFVYADINNNICLMLPNWEKKVFNSEEELDSLLAKL